MKPDHVRLIQNPSMIQKRIRQAGWMPMQILSSRVAGARDDARMALPIPFWGCFARLRLVTLVSFPNRPDDVELGVFQTAPNYAVDFHFRPLINFGARYLFSPFVGGGLRPALALRERRHRSVA